jgi:hypothetical protein
MRHRLDRRGRARLGIAIVLFCAGLALSLSLFTPTATSRTSECTVVCLPTTVPTTIPTTIPPPPELPAIPTTTTTPPPPSPTPPAPQAPPPPSPAPPPSTPTPPSAWTTPQAAPAAGLRVDNLRVTVARRGTRRFLVVTLTVSKAATARTELTRARRLVHRSAFGVRAGRSTRSMRLPGGLRPGRLGFLLAVSDGASRPLVFRRSVVVRR